jgi:oligoendopeptidase F
MERSEQLAKKFHETYERLAPSFGYKTREASAKPWADVPEQNKKLMIAVCAALLAEGELGP